MSESKQEDYEYYRFKSECLEEDLIDRNELKIALIYNNAFSDMTIGEMRKIYEVIDSIHSRN